VTQEEYQVIIPEERFAELEFVQEDLPGVGAVNLGLRGFEPKVVFGWHLSLTLELKDVDDRGMPTEEESKVINDFGDTLDLAIYGHETDKPNALFLGQLTWNGTRELLWRVFDPEKVNDYLQSIVNGNVVVRPRPFDFRMEHDPEWKLTEWHLAEHESA